MNGHTRKKPQDWESVSPLTTLHCNILKSQKDMLDRYADSQNKSVSSVVQDAINYYFVAVNRTFNPKDKQE